ncbi:MAG: peptide ABC transporter permease [Variovorax paradoxus]|nr:MAG: peptide ABC transporter permease [Variovorax paradoxus]PZQ00156.1 MAG: peptide ABC transporter permease [Variovorax paradoxus]
MSASNSSWMRSPVLRNRSVLLGGGALLLLVLLALFAPLLAGSDPTQVVPRLRLRAPSAEFLMGTDALGRDVWSRVAYGARVSLLISAVVAVSSLLIGALLGMCAGYVRWLDGPIMRTMDGIMAIPGILFAIALVSISGATIMTVVVAIALSEVPRVARLLRGVVLTLREEAFVEAAAGLGSRTGKVMLRHILPNTVAPLIVQGTYIFGAAMLAEATLSFLGAGLPPQTPSWGNVIAEGRAVFQRAPWTIFFPGACLALAVLAVNLMGDGLRDTLDPMMQKRVGGKA